MRKKVISEFTTLSQIHQQHLRLAIFVARSEDAIADIALDVQGRPCRFFSINQACAIRLACAGNANVSSCE